MNKPNQINASSESNSTLIVLAPVLVLVLVLEYCTLYTYRVGLCCFVKRMAEPCKKQKEEGDLGMRINRINRIEAMTSGRRASNSYSSSYL